VKYAVEKSKKSNLGVESGDANAYFGSGKHSIDAVAYNSYQTSVPIHLRKKVVVRTGNTVITFLFSPLLLNRCGVMVNNDGAYLSSRSILSFDPKYSNKDMFVLEVVFKEITLVGEPIIIAGVFMFSKQDSVTFHEILDILIQAEPSLRQAAWVFSDGCKTFGEAIDAKFPLAFHGVDRNHVERNITHFMRYEMELSTKAFKTWKRKVSGCLRGEGEKRGLYDYEDRREAAAFLEETLKQLPEALRNYISKNKSEILLGVHTQAARQSAGLVREDGTIDDVWSQASESAHMVLNRWLGENTATYKNVFEAMEAYYDSKIVALNLARHGSHAELRLKHRYQHIEFDRKVFARHPDATRPRWVTLTREDLNGTVGKMGLGVNTTSYKIISQDVINDEIDDEASMKSTAELSQSLSFPSKDHVIDKGFQLSSLLATYNEEAAVAAALGESLQENDVFKKERARLDSRITLLRLVSGDGYVTAQGNCGPDTLAAWLCARDGHTNEYWKTNRDRLSGEVRLKVSSFLKNNSTIFLPGFQVNAVTLSLIPRVESKTRPEESFTDFSKRMSRKNEWWEAPCWAAAAMLFQIRILVVLSCDNKDDNWILEWLPNDKFKTDATPTLIVANHSMVHFFPASSLDLFPGPSTAPPTPASSLAPPSTSSDETKQMFLFKQRNDIIEKAFFGSGLIEQAEDCIGLLNQSKQCLQKGVIGNHPESDIRFVPMLSLEGHYTVKGKMTECLTCNCKNGTSKNGKTLKNLCAHKLVSYLDLYKNNDDLAQHLQSCLDKYKQQIKPGAVSVVRVAAGCGPKTLGGPEQAVGKKAQQPTKSAASKSKREKSVNCSGCPAKILPGWGRCGECNATRPVENTCPKCGTNFGIRKMKFCPMSGCNFKFVDKATDGGVACPRALLEIGDAQLEVAAEGGSNGSSVLSAEAVVVNGTAITTSSQIL
jgi:hypothetical protein